MYFTDEMRYGTRTECKRRWCRRGRRPACPVRIGYDQAYLYLALCPFTGDLFACLCSHMDGDCFRYFARELGGHLRARGAVGPVALVGDRAASHSQANLPGGVVWRPLPTACPDLNPCENLFRELRKPLANRVFASKEEVQECLLHHLGQWAEDPGRVIRLARFSWMDDEYETPT